MVTVHHLGRTFTLGDVEPVADAPAAPDVTVDGVAVEPARADPGAPVTVTADVHGRIAFVFVELWWLDPATGIAFGPLHREHVAAPDAREIAGVRRPSWPDRISVRATLRAAWPVLWSGDAVTLAAPAPTGYDDVEREVRGIHAAPGGQPHDARLVVDGTGGFRRLLLRSPGGRPASWRPSAPAAGGEFTPILRALTPGPDGSWSDGRVRAEPLALTGRPIRLSTADPAPGRHLASIAAQDLDGRVARGAAEVEAGGP